MNRGRVVVALAVLTLAVAGCGGGGDHPAAKAPSPRPASTTAAAAHLKVAVRVALRDNDRLSTFVLSNNRVPSWATRSTDGPALAALKQSAATRRRQGVRVRTLADDLAITDLRIDPSYTSATAMVRDRQRVLPYRHGKRDRSVRHLDERARVELRRIGHEMRFVVWDVRPVS